MKNIDMKIKKEQVIAGAILLAFVIVILGIVFGSNGEEINSKRNEKNQQTKQETTGTSVNSEDADNQIVSEQAVTDSSSVPEVTQTPVPENMVSASPVVYPESEGARKVYLTFDDGTSEQTDKILDILKQYGVKATFFVTAQSGEANAARYRRIVAEGHSIGLHSVTHKYKEIYASLDTFIADVEGIRRFVLDTTGVNSYLYRFPGGSSNSVANVPLEDCIRYLNQNGYRYFDWNIDTADSVNREQSADELVSRALGENIEKYHNSIILMHDSGSQAVTVEALPRIIEGLKARGMEILPITENTPPCQHKKADSVQ